MSRRETQRKKATVRFWKHHTGPMECFHCKCLVSREVSETSPNKATVDHLVAISLGGTHDLSNMVLACFPCNNKRSDLERIQAIQMQKINYRKPKIRLKYRFA